MGKGIHRVVRGGKKEKLTNEVWVVKNYTRNPWANSLRLLNRILTAEHWPILN